MCQQFNLSLDAVVGAGGVESQMVGACGLREAVVPSVLASDGWTFARFVHDGVVTYAASPSYERDICPMAELSDLPRHLRFPPFIHEEDLEPFFAFVGALWGTLRLHNGAGKSSSSCERPARIFNRSRGKSMRCLYGAEMYVQYGGRVVLNVLAFTDAEPPFGEVLQPNGALEVPLPGGRSPGSVESPLDVLLLQGTGSGEGALECNASLLPALSATTVCAEHATTSAASHAPRSATTYDALPLASVVISGP
jgi:hypothetical protein